ncbi:hypothetical protein BBNG_00655 [Bifidobacterium bifidum NCIMB 41171]|nr:hypothetical protein BBNG_00655 [Bifidobacterium bifidum NCIMB 41171]
MSSLPRVNAAQKGESVVRDISLHPHAFLIPCHIRPPALHVCAVTAEEWATDTTMTHDNV